jgi:hypothetical protein
VVSGELCFDPAQGGLGCDELAALARRYGVPADLEVAALAFVLRLLAVILDQLAFVRAALAPVGPVVPDIGEAVALIGGRVPAIRGGVARAGIAPGAVDHVRAFGGVPLMLGVHALEFGGILIVLQRLTVQRGGTLVEIGQDGVGLLEHQALAAFGGLALGAGVLAGLIGEPLRALCTLAMLVRACGGHG